MTQPKKDGDTISVHYTGKFEDGTVFDSSMGRAPIMFTVGSGHLIKGFNDAVLGLVQGDKNTVTITPEEGYGERRDDFIINMPKSTLPEGMELEVGMQAPLADKSGNPVPAVVYEILDDVIRMDINHPLAGKTLIYDIEILQTGLEPLQHSHDAGGCSCGCESNCNPDCNIDCSES